MKSCAAEWPAGPLVDEKLCDGEGGDDGKLGFAFAALLNSSAVA
jgi:hypothetical protein